MSAQAFAKRTRIDSMLADIGNDPKLKRHQYETGPRLVEILTKRGADPLEAQAAAEIARHGTLTPETEAKLKRAGIKIPTSWRGTPRDRPRRAARIARARGRPVPFGRGERQPAAAPSRPSRRAGASA
jgi:hypothetical protein